MVTALAGRSMASRRNPSRIRDSGLASRAAGWSLAIWTRSRPLAGVDVAQMLPCLSPGQRVKGRAVIDVEVLRPADPERAAELVIRDGFAVIADVLTGAEIEGLRVGVDRVAKTLVDQVSPRVLRGLNRFSLPQTINEPEWAALINHPVALDVLARVWGGDDFTCLDAGGDFSLPGAPIQPLHSDLPDFFYDPLAQTTFSDVPAPFVVVNYLVDDFTLENGPIRFVPRTQRLRNPVPDLDQEPESMKQSVLCAPAGTAIVRDTRTWHAGTANNSDRRRAMVGFGYLAPWFRGGRQGAGRIPWRELRPDVYVQLSPRARSLVAHLVDFEPLLPPARELASSTAARSVDA